MPSDLYVTLRGLPLALSFEWPFHKSHGGSDFYVLHGNALLEDGSERYAALAVQMSQTVFSVLQSGDEAKAKAAAVSAVRKAADVQDIEFLKSSKKQPIPLSSRQYSIVQQRFTFHNASDAELKAHIERTAFWRSRRGKGAAQLDDASELLYLTATAERMKEAAAKSAAEGLVTVQGSAATATDALLKQATRFETEMKSALEQLEAKHAFERA